jgi:hypothetical protein
MTLSLSKEGNCDIHVKRKISFMNETKQFEILPRPKGWVYKILRTLLPNFVKGVLKSKPFYINDSEQNESEVQLMLKKPFFNQSS